MIFRSSHYLLFYSHRQAGIPRWKHTPAYFMNKITLQIQNGNDIQCNFVYEICCKSACKQACVFELFLKCSKQEKHLKCEKKSEQNFRIFVCVPSSYIRK